MKQIDNSFAQTLLVISVIAAIIVIFFLWWDNGQQNNFVMQKGNRQIQQTDSQLSPSISPVTKKESIDSIEADFSKIDSTQYEKDADTGLTQLGTDALAL